jgi:drug/metabolite transporter (DMT)-like permease
VTVVLVALGSALAYAVASVLQQQAAAAQPPERSLRPAIVMALARQPLWLAGIGASAVGLLLQLLALDHGSLTVVQPVLVCGLIFALPINAVGVQKRRLTRKEWLSASAVTAGLALFLVSAGPGGGRPDASGGVWLLVVAVFAGTLALVVGAARALHGPGRALVLACGAGAANALSAAFTKSVAHEASAAFHSGVAHLVATLASSWTPYALVASLAVVIVLVQSAFQAGPISWSLPALTALNPVAAVTIGVTVLHEKVQLGLAAGAGELCGLMLAAAGVLALGTSPAFATRPFRGPLPAAAPASPPA